MRKKRVVLIVLLLILIPVFMGCTKKDNLYKIKLTEVAHSIFYAPQYVSIELGFFKDEGIDLKLNNGLGADKTMTAV